MFKKSTKVHQYKGFIHLQQKHATILCNVKEGYISLECLKNAKSKDYRGTLGNLLTVLKSTGLNKAIFDVQKLDFIAEADQHWITDTWLPEALDSGLEFNAIITSSIPSNQYSVDALLDKIQVKDSSLEIYKFTNREDALHWFSKL